MSNSVSSLINGELNLTAVKATERYSEILQAVDSNLDNTSNQVLNRMSDLFAGSSNVINAYSKIMSLVVIETVFAILKGESVNGQVQPTTAHKVSSVTYVDQGDNNSNSITLEQVDNSIIVTNDLTGENNTSKLTANLVGNHEGNVVAKNLIQGNDTDISTGTFTDLVSIHPTNNVSTIDNIVIGSKTPREGNFTDVNTTSVTVSDLSVTGNVTGVTTSHVTEGEDNLYFTQDRARGAFTAGTGISLNAGDISVDTDVIATNASVAQAVDNYSQGLDIKDAVQLATTPKNGNIDLSSSTTELIIDGVQVQVGNRVLINHQTNDTDNGIYIVNADNLQRATDMDEPGEFKGAFVFVLDGTDNKGHAFVQIGGVATVGTHPVNFTQFTGAQSITPGHGISISGNTIYTNQDISPGKDVTFGVVTGTISSLDNHDTDSLSEGTVNKYYTDERARASISASGSIAYDSTTGVISFSANNVGDGLTEKDGSIALDETYNATFKSVTAETFTGSLTGTVTSLSNHTTDNLSEGATNKYFSSALARNAISTSNNSILSYDKLGGIIALNPGNFGDGLTGTHEVMKLDESYDAKFNTLNTTNVSGFSVNTDESATELLNNEVGTTTLTQYLEDLYVKYNKLNNFIANLDGGITITDSDGNEVPY